MIDVSFSNMTGVLFLAAVAAYALAYSLTIALCAVSRSVPVFERLATRLSAWWRAGL